MSFIDVFSYWRCPSCKHENKYNLTWQHFMEFKEIPNETYSKEICNCCGKEFFVNAGEPNPICFTTNKGKCKNDYIKNMVIDASNKLTIVHEHWTT